MDSTKLKSRLSEKVQTIGESTEAKLSGLQAANVESSYIALNSNALDMIRENLKSQPLSLELFDVVKSPSGGATVFSVPGLSGDEAEKELTGIILDYTTPRAYWDTPDPVEGTPPVCMSQNSIISQDGKACALCPYNDFGSKDGESNAKACKESVLLFLLRPNSIIPLLVRVPVTSKPRFLKYSTRLLSVLTPVSSVVTKITLEKATSRAGKPYALFNFEAVGTLSPEEAAQARVYGRQFMEIVNAANNSVIRQNCSLVQAAHLDRDDVYQSLALRLIRAVERYRPGARSLKGYIFSQLKYELLNCKSAQRRYGFSNAPYDLRETVVSLETLAEADQPWEPTAGVVA